MLGVNFWRHFQCFCLFEKSLMHLIWQLRAGCPMATLASPGFHSSADLARSVRLRRQPLERSGSQSPWGLGKVEATTPPKQSA